MSNILFIGAGALGGAMIRGLSLQGQDFTIHAIDPTPSPELLALGVRFQPDDATISSCDTVIISVKPQIWTEACADLAQKFHKEAHIFSVMAGVKLSRLKALFSQKSARLMPTTGVATAKGVCAIFAEDDVVRAHAHDFMRRISDVTLLSDEDQMDAVTALAGCGPAYVYAFVDALCEAGARIGLDQEQAANLARATVISAARLLDQSDLTAQKLRENVTSKGGVTAAGLEVLMGQDRLTTLLEETLKAAKARSVAMSQEF